MSHFPYLFTYQQGINRAFRTAPGNLTGDIQPFQDGLLIVIRRIA